jgi:hypothetical protein
MPRILNSSHAERGEQKQGQSEQPDSPNASLYKGVSAKGNHDGKRATTRWAQTVCESL